MKIRKTSSLRTTSLRAAVVAALALSGVAVNSYADSATANMAVSASVSNSCAVNVGTLDFGSYDPVVGNVGADLDATTSLDVACTNGSLATIELSQGDNPDVASTGTAPLRRLSNGTNFLNYNLFQEVSRSEVWGDTTSGVSYEGTGAADSYTVFGRIFAGQNVPAGSYTDNVVASVTF